MEKEAEGGAFASIFLATNFSKSSILALKVLVNVSSNKYISNIFFMMYGIISLIKIE